MLIQIEKCENGFTLKVSHEVIGREKVFIYDNLGELTTQVIVEISDEYEPKKDETEIIQSNG